MEEENKQVLEEFEIIDNTINIINDIPNIQDVEPMTHALDNFIYELREDEVEESANIEDLLSNCDNENGEEVVIPKVVG